uniref:Uncharacterized protein n=1 Tax=Quercus lobata TaxID=97700 RepID=A0A7N2M5G8_QUELO
MASSSFLSLSREEQEELAHSNKKVKNVNHAGFSDSSDSRPSSPNQPQGMWSQAISFKDKVVGEIPGAYTQAFNFGDLMKDDEESDDEVEALREGLVALKFSRELKQKIRHPWARALIVKCATLPGRVLDGIDRVNRNFLWGSTENQRKMHWVGWQKVTRAKEEGGLGLQTARGRNIALLAKLN